MTMHGYNRDGIASPQRPCRSVPTESRRWHTRFHPAHQRLGGDFIDYYPLTDLLHRTVALTDDTLCEHGSSGTSATGGSSTSPLPRYVEVYDIDVYGRTRIYKESGYDHRWFTEDDVATNHPRCAYLFAGYRYDSESGLHFVRARYYHPDFGRFISRDPLMYEAGDMNLYGYCLSNPTVHTDPDGEVIPLVILGAIALLGAVHGGSSVYMADPNSSGLAIAGGAALGGVFGLLNPIGTVGSAVGSSIGYWGGKASGAWDPNAGYQWGGLVGGLSGGFAGGIRTGLKSLLWESSGAAIGAGAGYGITGTGEGALVGAQFGALGGGAARTITGRILRYRYDYLFRGTTPGWEGGPITKRLNITPASTDPGVATVFATQAETNFGEGILLGLRRSRIRGVKIERNVLAALESEAAPAISASRFEALSDLRISAKRAREILEGMGRPVPANVQISDIRATLEQIGKLSEKQIRQFVKRARL